MKKIAKRFLLIVALLLVAVLGVLVGGIYLARAEPAFYHTVALSAEQLEAAAQSATNKFATIQNRVARVAANNRAAGTTAASTHAINADADQPIVITFTADELNAFFDKWSTFQNWKSAYARYITDPVVILQDGRLILAGKAVDLGLLVSLHFEPSIDENGQLRLKLARVLGGRLPLPTSIVDGWESKATKALSAKLPQWRKAAAFDSGGAANPSLIAASSATLLFHVLRDEPADPVLFLPVLGQRGSVPVRITTVQVDDGKLTLTVDPMTREQRDALLQRVQTESVLSIDSPQ